MPRAGRWWQEARACGRTEPSRRPTSIGAAPPHTLSRPQDIEQGPLYAAQEAPPGAQTAPPTGARCQRGACHQKTADETTYSKEFSVGSARRRRGSTPGSGSASTAGHEQTLLSSTNAPARSAGARSYGGCHLHFHQQERIAFLRLRTHVRAGAGATGGVPRHRPQRTRALLNINTIADGRICPGFPL